MGSMYGIFTTMYLNKWPSYVDKDHILSYTYATSGKYLKNSWRNCPLLMVLDCVQLCAFSVSPNRRRVRPRWVVSVMDPGRLERNGKPCGRSDFCFFWYRILPMADMLEPQKIWWFKEQKNDLKRLSQSAMLRLKWFLWTKPPATWWRVQGDGWS